MYQYVIYAFDGNDDAALERRLTARPFHLATAKQLKANNQFITGGAILDAAGKMIGSTMLVQFDSPAAFQAWFDNDPYVTMNVWQKIEVHPFRVAEV